MDQRVRLRGGELRAVRLEVEAEDQVGTERLCKRTGHLQPLVGDVERHPRWPFHACHGPPRPVGAVAADSQDRRLPRGEVADELLEHRIERARVRAGIGLERGVLDRHAEESRRHDRIARPRVDLDRRRVPTRAVGVATSGAREHQSEHQYDHDRHDRDVEVEEPARAPRFHKLQFRAIGGRQQTCNRRQALLQYDRHPQLEEGSAWISA
jgi:hypothetical protein